MKRRLPVQPASKRHFVQPFPVTVKSFIPAIATGMSVLSLIHTGCGECPECHYPPPSKENAGRSAFAPVNNVESRSANKQVNNNPPTGFLPADLPNKEMSSLIQQKPFSASAAIPISETAVTRLLALKQRPTDKGLILIAASFEQLKPYIDDSILTAAQR